jgi:hypothetical protein
MITVGCESLQKAVFQAPGANADKQKTEAGQCYVLRVCCVHRAR